MPTAVLERAGIKVGNRLQRWLPMEGSEVKLDILKYE